MDFAKARFNMVEQQIRPWDVLDFDLLDALEAIPREAFVGEEQKNYAYADIALPLPNGGAMLEPKIVARMIQGLALKKTDKVLEIGTGSGYASAVLSKLAAEVVTVDIDPEQQARAKAVLDGLGYDNIVFQTNDGLMTQNAAAPFDAVYVGGAVDDIPEILKQQLRDGGRLIAVTGSHPVQRARLITRNGDSFSEKTLFDTMMQLTAGHFHPAVSTQRPSENGKPHSHKPKSDYVRHPATDPATTARQTLRILRYPAAGRTRTGRSRPLPPAEQHSDSDERTIHAPKRIAGQQRNHRLLPPRHPQPILRPLSGRRRF